MPKMVKQYGLQRTGTNYVERLLRLNYDVRVLTNKGGWKHGPYRLPELLGEDLDCIVSIKNPLSWLWSMHKYKPNGEHFRTHVRNGRYINLWNEYYRAFDKLRLDHHKVIVVRYEDVLENTQTTIERIAYLLGLESTTKTFQDVETVIRSGHRVTRVKFDRSFYLKKKYLGSFDKELLTFAFMALDKELLREYGYYEEIQGQIA